MRKAQVEIQFNWIFVLIAGFIILLFFISIVYKQKSSADVNLAADISEDFKAILTGAGLSTRTVNVIQLPDISINFECSANGDSWFGIDQEKTGVKNRLETEAVFAPDTIKGNEMITLALEFDAPFKIMNLLFVTSPGVRYIFVGNGLEDAYNKLPDEMNKERIQLSELANLKDLKNYKVKLVFLESTPALPDAFKNMADNDVSAIHVLQNTVDFYSKKGDYFASEGTVVVSDPILIYGAIFSQDFESCFCNIRKVYKRLGYVAEIYSSREKALQQYFTEHPDSRNCKEYYTGSVNSVKASAEACYENAENCVLPVTQVKNDNSFLKRVSCPMLY
jgi:hypothetical protein